MKRLPTLNDSRGRASHTLMFVVVALLVLIVKFAVSGLILFGYHAQEIAAQDFGIAFAAILAPWLGREWTEKQGAE